MPWAVPVEEVFHKHSERAFDVPIAAHSVNEQLVASGDLEVVQFSQADSRVEGKISVGMLDLVSPAVDQVQLIKNVAAPEGIALRRSTGFIIEEILEVPAGDLPPLLEDPHTRNVVCDSNGNRLCIIDPLKQRAIACADVSPSLGHLGPKSCWPGQPRTQLVPTFLPLENPIGEDCPDIEFRNGVEDRSWVQARVVLPLRLCDAAGHNDRIDLETMALGANGLALCGIEPFQKLDTILLAWAGVSGAAVNVQV